MDFFEQQEKARRNTRRLAAYFVGAVILLIALVYFVALAGVVDVGFHYALALTHQRFDPAKTKLWHPQVFLCTTVGVLAVIFFGSAYKIRELSAGGTALASLMGGRFVHPNSTDPDERRLLNVVEEMSLASGIPLPLVYVLDDEPGINAFAAGHTPADAAISVTRGCLDLLSRDELQGVIGHEFSHILNGDMRLNLRLIGLIFGLFCLSTTGRVLLCLQGRDRRGRTKAVPLLPIFGLALIVIGAVGVFFGRLIQAAICRQREFLADAAAVQFTRNPAGLSGALQKMGGYPRGSKLQSAHAPDLCHMFFGNGLGNPLLRALATHPPLPDRIRAIDRSWDGQWIVVSPPPATSVQRPSKSTHLPSPKLFPDAWKIMLGGAAAIPADPPPETAPAPVVTVMPNLDAPTARHLEYAARLRDSLPDTILAAAREPLDAVALIYALLLSPDEPMRASQLTGLEQKTAPGVCTEIEALYPEVAAAAVHAHLPMVNLALGGLRGLSLEQYQEFADTLDWLIQSDGKVELFEFVLRKIVLRDLAPHFGVAPQAPAEYYSLKPLLPDCALILSALANVGSTDPAEIQQAFDAGRIALTTGGEVSLLLVPRAECGINKIDAVLNRLAAAVPVIKKAVLTACIQVVGADGIILETEAELLRAIAATLDCPLPPFVQPEGPVH